MKSADNTFDKHREPRCISGGRVQHVVIRGHAGREGLGRSMCAEVDQVEPLGGAPREAPRLRKRRRLGFAHHAASRMPTIPAR